VDTEFFSKKSVFFRTASVRQQGGGGQAHVNRGDRSKTQFLCGRHKWMTPCMPLYSMRLQTFVLFENKNINWTSGAPPDDKPVCGYRGENCISPSSKHNSIMDF